MSRIALTAVCVTGVIVGMASSAALAGAIGAGPGTIDAGFFPNDPSVYVTTITVTSNDEAWRGFTAVMPDIPTGVHASFSQTSEVRNLDYSMTGLGSGRWDIPLVLGRTSSEFTGPPDSVTKYITITEKSADSGGGGIPVITSVRLNLNLHYLTPQIPRTLWSFTNISEYDILDGHIMYAPNHYIDGLTIPAGATVTLEGQMDPAWHYTFGGILDNATHEIVVGLDDMAGPGPNRLRMGDLFDRGDDVPRDGWSAAYLALWPRAGTYWLHGSPNELPCVTVMSAPTDGSLEFNLYAIPNGDVYGYGRESTDAIPVAQVVGHASASAMAVPAPTSLSLWAAGVIGLLLLTRMRRSSPGFRP
jgi:hypothetical protein